MDESNTPGMSLEQEKIWTYEDYCELPEDGNRYEVLQGRLYLAPAPSPFHQKLVLRISHWLYPLELTGQGSIYLAPIDLVMQDATPIQPDLLFLASRELSKIEEKCIRGAPTLVVEVLSPSTSSRDRTLKLHGYAKNGVAWYWLVDPEEKTLLVLGLDGDTYRVESSLTVGTRFVWSAYPEVAFNLDDLFAPSTGQP